MSISTRVNNFLQQHHIKTDCIQHVHSHSSISTGVAAQIPIHNIAKAVVLEVQDGQYMMAIIPADYRLDMKKTQEMLDRPVKLAKEEQLSSLFTDCEPGAVPPVAEAYDMECIYDDSLHHIQDFYLEAGDHELLLHLFWEDFVQLVADSKHGSISLPILH